MVGLLAAGGVAVVAVALWLVVISWRSRTVLGALLGSAAIALVVFAFVSDPASGRSEGVLLAALIALLLGAALYGIGHVLERLLGGELDERG